MTQNNDGQKVIITCNQQLNRYIEATKRLKKL